MSGQCRCPLTDDTRTSCRCVSECRSVEASECRCVRVSVFVSEQVSKGVSVYTSALVFGPTPIHPSIHKVCHLKGRASSQGYSFSPTFVMCSIRHSNAHKLTNTVNTINTINTVIPFIHKVCHLESRASSQGYTFSFVVYVQLGTPEAHELIKTIHIVNASTVSSIHSQSLSFEG